MLAAHACGCHLARGPCSALRCRLHMQQSSRPGPCPPVCGLMAGMGLNRCQSNCRLCWRCGCVSVVGLRPGGRCLALPGAGAALADLDQPGLCPVLAYRRCRSSKCAISCWNAIGACLSSVRPVRPGASWCPVFSASASYNVYYVKLSCRVDRPALWLACYVSAH